MNHNIRQMFVVKSGEALMTSGGTIDLAEGQVGVFNSSGAAVSVAPSVSSSPFLMIAQGSGDNTIGSFKSSDIYLRRVTAWRGTSPDTSSNEQITYVGWDEINQCLSPDIACEKSYTVIIRIFEHFLHSVYCPFLQEGVVVKAPCCDDCSDNCDSLDCSAIFQEFADKINANPRLSNYVSAEAVKTLVSGSPATVKFAIVLPDPGTSVGGIVDFTQTNSAAGLTNGTNTGVASSTGGSGTGATFNVVVAGNVVTSVAINAAGSGYEIGDTVTIAGSALTGGTSPADDITVTVTQDSGPEGDLLGQIRTLYSDFVDNVETGIVYSADADSSDSDANATGNVMIEMTPSDGVTLNEIDPFEGVDWFDLPCQDAGDAVYSCGLKITGTTPEGLTPVDCLPETVPYIANKVRFKVYAGEAPSSSQLEDLEDFCNLWEIKTTQKPTYPIGEGRLLAEVERDYAGVNQPWASGHRYYIPFYNGDLITFADKTLEYDVYELEYLDSSPRGFEHKSDYPFSVMIAVPTSMTSWKTAFETIINTYLANSPAYFPAVNL